MIARMPKALKLPAFAAVFALGVLLAWTLGAAGHAADTTTGDTTAAVETTTAAETTTGETATEVAPATTAFATTTLQVTTTRFVAVTPSGAEDDTPAWVWALVAILAVALIALIALLARRGRGSVPVEQRRRHLDAAVSSWAAQGWAIESETADAAVLRRGSDTMIVSVDTAGHVSTRPLPAS